MDLDSSPPPAAQADTRTDYFTASGFYHPTPNIVSGPDTNLASAGLADHGTRLVARFKNVPPGVALTASLYSRNPSIHSAARLVLANPDGTGPFVAAAKGNIPIVDGVGTAVWEYVGGSSRPDI